MEELGENLFDAATLGTPSNVMKALENGGRPDWRGIDGWTPLHGAARHGKERNAAILLEAGANARLTDERGSTPLHLAALGG